MTLGYLKRTFKVGLRVFTQTTTTPNYFCGKLQT